MNSCKHAIKINKQEIDHKSRASRNLGQCQRSYSGTGCGIFKTWCKL